MDQANAEQAREWQRRRYDAGLGWITGPVEFGGRGLSTAHDLTYDTVESEYDVPDTGVLSVIGLGMIGPTILAHAQPHIKQRVPARDVLGRGDRLPAVQRTWGGLGPGQPVDARPNRDEATASGTLNGQKVWTSIAQHADIGMALCRTNPDQPKHKGITAFIVDMSAPGVEVRPLRQMTGGSDFNEVFLTDVRVPDDHRLGNVDEGWRVALTTLMNERATVGGEGAGPAGRVAVAALPGGTATRRTAALDDGAARRQLAALHADMMATEYLNRQTARRMRGGEQPGPGGLGLQAHVRAEPDPGHALRRRGASGRSLIADTGEWGAFSWNELLLSTPALRILGGTEEIMKNILAERVLGLPKEPGIDSKTPFRELRR